MLEFSFNCRENINKYFLKIFECRNCPVLLTNVRVFISTKKNSKYRERLRVITRKYGEMCQNNFQNDTIPKLGRKITRS